MVYNDLLHSEVRKGFRKYFEEISQKIAETISKSEQKQDNLADENYLTGKIIEIINDYDKTWLQDKVKEITGLYLNIYARRNNVKEENQIGADLGIVLSISGDNIEVNKAILVQAKKAKWNGDYISYLELRKRGREQAVKMLKITPASFFLWKKIASKYGIFPFFPFFPYGFFSPRIVCGWYAGIIVLPATEIKAIKKLTAVNLESFLPGCISFADFMVDYFLTCYVGDSRISILEKAGYNSNLIDKIITRWTMFIY